MAITAVATLQPMLDCKWSRPGYRLTGVSDHKQPEGHWVCVRTDARPAVNDKDCGDCRFWELDPKVA